MSFYYYEPSYDWDRFFEDAFTEVGRPSRGGGARRRVGDASIGDVATRGFRPSMDLHEDKDNNAVTATFELPGVKKDDVDIDVHNGRLIVSAETKVSDEHDEGGYAIRERRFGKFSRTLQLPPGVQDGDVEAKMENGVLTVTFPKTTPDQEHRRITIA